MTPPPPDRVAEPSPPPIAPALALSGGGARCLAQLGVLAVLARAGVRPPAIAASSSSAFIAALWAAGHSPAASLRILLGAAARLPFDIDAREGLLGHGGLVRGLAPHLPDRFEDLDRPIAVVAIDAERGERVVLDSGPLLPALLASNAFPGLFAPIRLQGRLLIDGGAIEMVPVRAALERWDAPVLAVDVGSPPNLDLSAFGDVLPAGLRRGAVATARAASLGWTSYVVTQQEMVRYHLEVHRPRWLVRPDLADDLGLFRFDRAAEAVRAGRRSTRAILPGLSPSPTR